MYLKTFIHNGRTERIGNGDDVVLQTWLEVHEERFDVGNSLFDWKNQFWEKFLGDHRFIGDANSQSLATMYSGDQFNKQWDQLNKQWDQLNKLHSRSEY